MRNIVDSYVTAFILLIIGVYFIRASLRELKSGDIDWNSPWQGHIKGWAAGIMFIAASVIIFVMKLKK
jgi:putative Mn2+ efflux pump MntP